MKKSRLTDEQLADRAAEYRRLRSEERAAKTLAEAERDVILAELAARSAMSVVAGGLTVTAKANRRTSYDIDAAKTLLKPAVFRKITHLSIVHDAVQAQLTAGAITVDDVATFSTVDLSSPYLLVTAA